MNFSKQYKNKIILKNVNLELPPSGIIGLISPNGMGKTTLLRMFGGLRKPTNGLIKDMSSAINPDILDIYDFSLDGLGKLYQSFYSDFNLNQYLNILKETNLSGKLMYSSLSKGHKTVVTVMLTISRNVELYLLDEPFSGLDFMTRNMIVNQIVTKVDVENKLVIISSHDFSHLERLIDYVMMIKNKKLVLHSIDTIEQPLVEWYKENII